jgi:ABC-type nitrate/sulfonate/bicarbonate transport system substrate-binding protein
MHFIKVLLIASALIGGVAHANDRVRVGKSQGSAWTFLPLDVGVEQGLFARHGIEIEIAELPGDAKLQQGFAAGGIDFGLGSGPGMAFAAKGSPVIATGWPSRWRSRKAGARTGFAPRHWAPSRPASQL